MRVLYLIGNGFDLNLSLRTRYSQFYESYLKEESKSEDITKFKQYLSDQKERNIELWSDLELVLGESTKLYDDKDAFIAVYGDINESLRKYITDQNNRLINDANASDKFISYLKNPFKDLCNRDMQNIRNYFGRFGKDWDVSFMTFNYTSSIEKLIGNNLGKDIEKNIFGGTSHISSIEHIHGNCDETILVGVNDVNQISNKSFWDNSQILRRLVKPTSNHTIGSLCDEMCTSLISNANLIICFGLSFGLTDSIWWSTLSQDLGRPDKRVIVFDYRPEVDITHNRMVLGDYRDMTISKIISISETNKSDHIIYALNPEFFSGLDSCVIID